MPKNDILSLLRAFKFQKTSFEAWGRHCSSFVNHSIIFYYIHLVLYVLGKSRVISKKFLTVSTIFTKIRVMTSSQAFSNLKSTPIAFYRHFNTIFNNFQQFSLKLTSQLDPWPWLWPWTWKNHNIWPWTWSLTSVTFLTLVLTSVTFDLGEIWP